MAIFLYGIKIKRPLQTAKLINNKDKSPQKIALVLFLTIIVICLIIIVLIKNNYYQTKQTTIITKQLERSQNNIKTIRQHKHSYNSEIIEENKSHLETIAEISNSDETEELYTFNQ